MTALVHSLAELRRHVAALRGAGRRIALVPTMGALHDGHLSLVRLGQARGAATVATIFVNPTQFGANEDFARYPRGLDADVEKLTEASCDLVFAPSVDEVYPTGFSTKIIVDGVSAHYEGEHRPGHFSGMATIVAKLLAMAGPDIAIFGEKDWQQLAVIRRFVTDLNLPVEIVGAPIAREADGLAMSSRNRYLTAEQRQIAPALYRALVTAAQAIRNEPNQLRDILERARSSILGQGFTKIDYFDLADPDGVTPISRYAGRGRLLAAGVIGATRLIDNMAV